MTISNLKIPMLILTAIALLAVPHVVEDYYMMHMIIMFLIWSLFSSSYNILLNAGQLSLAHNALFAVGGYASAIFMMKFGVPFALSMILGAALAMLCGLFIGKITVKMRGSHFVLVTFAFAEICRISANNWTSVTNGPNGLRGIPGPEFFGVPIFEMSSLYYIALALLAMVLFVSWRMLYGRLGRTFIALRTSEDLAEAVGLGHTKYIMIAIAVSCFLTGIAGAYYAHYITLVSPELSKFQYMIYLLIMVIAGGRYTLGGPIVGAGIFVFLTEFLRFFDMYRMLIFGVLLILVVMYMPSGLYPSILSWIKRTFKGKGPGTPANEKSEQDSPEPALNPGQKLSSKES